MSRTFHAHLADVYYSLEEDTAFLPASEEDSAGESSQREPEADEHVGYFVDSEAEAARLFQRQITGILGELKSVPEHSEPFKRKVSRKIAPDYYEVIREPVGHASCVSGAFGA